jgi:hypothetical protein
MSEVNKVRSETRRAGDVETFDEGVLHGLARRSVVPAIGPAQDGVVGQFGTVSLTIVLGLPREPIRRSSSRATCRSESDVSVTGDVPWREPAAAHAKPRRRSDGIDSGLSCARSRSPCTPDARSSRAADGRRPLASQRASPFFYQKIRQRGVVQYGVRQQLLQPGILPLSKRRSQATALRSCFR